VRIGRTRTERARRAGAVGVDGNADETKSYSNHVEDVKIGDLSNEGIPGGVLQIGDDADEERGQPIAELYSAFEFEQVEPR
jgi:hypothetical protein